MSDIAKYIFRVLGQMKKYAYFCTKIICSMGVTYSKKKESVDRSTTMIFEQDDIVLPGDITARPTLSKDLSETYFSELPEGEPQDEKTEPTVPASHPLQKINLIASIAFLIILVAICVLVAL